MKQVATMALLWSSAIGTGLIAGLYFAFSAFIMTALGRLDQSSGIAAMNAINVDILRSLFMPIFLGTSLFAAIIAVLGLLRWGEPAALPMIAGGVIYVVGMLVVTMTINVPLNNALTKVALETPEAATLWATYLKDWTFWNHLRTVASTVSMALFIRAIALS